jgi:hypothetical protein
MAVALALTYVERNDNKVLTLTDTTSSWVAPLVSEISTLTLDVSITTSDNVTTAYTQVDLVLLNSLGVDSTQADMVFVITAADIGLGTTDDVFPDGIYKFIYTVDEGLATESSLEEYVLMEGNVRNSVYEALRIIPTLYECNECKSKEIMDAIFAYGYLNSIRAGGYVAKTEELLTQLFVLERILNYGSSYTW